MTHSGRGILTNVGFPPTERPADTVRLILHHLAIDQLESLGRDANFTPKWVVEENNQANHRAGEEGDEASKQQMSAKA